MKDLNLYFDHTLLKPEASINQLETLCCEAKDYNFYSVCVNSCNVKIARDFLQGSPVKVAAVVGFPLGACTTLTKVFETEECCKDGAEEIDMVLNIGRLKDKDFNYVREDISAVVKAAKKYNAIVKVILETCLLNDEEVSLASKLSLEANAAFIKTSTGFSTGGATLHHVKLMRDAVGNKMMIKASGGIRDYKTVKEFIDAGVDRIGASATVNIMKESK